MFDKKEFLRLFWPVLIEQTLTVTIGMVNTMMVSGVGVEAISAVSIVDSLNFVIVNLFIAFSTGATVVIAQQIGAGQTDGAFDTASQSMTACVFTAVLSSIAFIIFGNSIISWLFGNAEEQIKSDAMVYLIYSGISYPFLGMFSMSSGILRASGNTKAPMRASVISNIVNAAVGALCIYLLDLGVAGAGMALLFSRITGAGVLILVLLRPEKDIGIKKTTFRLDKNIIWPVLRIGVPASIDGLVFNGGKLLVQTFITGLGTVALGANSIANSMTGLISIPGNTVSLVAVTIIGQAVGAGIYGKNLRKEITILSLYSIALLTVMSVVLFPLLPFALDLYAPPAEVKNLTLSILNIMLLVMPFTWPLAFVLPSCLRSTGDSLFVTVVSIISMWLTRVLGSWYIVNYTGWGLLGIWIFWCVDWVVRDIAFVIRAKTSPYINRAPNQAPDNTAAK